MIKKKEMRIIDTKVSKNLFLTGYIELRLQENHQIKDIFIDSIIVTI